MKTLYWDSGDPLDCWDNPNCFFDAQGIGRRREENDPGYVVWFPPGYTPPKASTPKKRKRPTVPPPTNLPAMSDTYQYITRPTANGEGTMTQAVYRGTKTKDDLVAEITTRLAGTPNPPIDAILCTFSEVVIDWCTQGWKIAPCHDLIGYRLTTGGSNPIGTPEDWNFDSMNIDINCHWGETGEARSRALFTAEKVGEQSRSAPVFVEVYDSETKELNHYQVAKGLYMKVSNNRFEFDPARGCKVRFRKADNTYVDAAGYPYVKGKVVVCTPPAGLTGTVHLELTALINGALRTSEYPFPLT